MDLISYKQKKYFMLITSKGIRTNLAAIAEMAEKLSNMAGISKTPFMLLDYREVTYEVPMTHTIDLMRIHEPKMTNLKNVTMAVVIRSSERKIAELWKEVSEKKGLWFTLFDNLKEAEEWLTDQAKMFKKI
jgi:hypothetical protein